MKLKLPFGFEIELGKDVCPDCKGENVKNASGRLTLCATCRKPVDPNARLRGIEGIAK